MGAAGGLCLGVAISGLWSWAGPSARGFRSPSICVGVSACVAPAAAAQELGSPGFSLGATKDWFTTLGMSRPLPEPWFLCLAKEAGKRGAPEVPR